MTKGSVKIEFVEGQAITPRRAIAWLVGGDDLDAKSAFDNLDDDNSRFVRDSMKAWIDGTPDLRTRFHGFPNDTTFKDGYQFNYREQGVHHRLYGFKMRPGIPDGRFDICALAVHATKTNQTPNWVKAVVSRLRDDEAIRTAITRQVREHFASKLKKGWSNK